MSSSSLVEGSRPPPPRSRRKPRKSKLSHKMPPPGTQQHPAGGFVTGAQVAASNQTLNTWFSGRRQPSWMTSQQPQVVHHNQASMPGNHYGENSRAGRPPSRSQRRPSLNTSSDSSRLTSGAVPTSSARLPDGSQDKFVAALEHGKQTNDCAAALPSPAPTDQPSPPTVTSNQPQNQTQDPEAQSPGLGHNQFGSSNSMTTGPDGNFAQEQATAAVPAQSGQPMVTPAGHSTARFMAHELPDRPPLSSVSPALQDSTSNEPLAAPTARKPAPAITPSAVPAIEPPTSQGVASTPAVVHNSPIAFGSGQPRNPQPAPPRGGVVQLPNQGRQGGQQVANVAARNARPVNHRDCLNVQTMSKKFDQYIDDCGGFSKLPADATTAPRFKLLKEAIAAGDYFYIVLHQILCVWSLNKELAHSILAIPFATADSGMSVVQSTLRRTDNMAHAHVIFFANFPDTYNSGLWATDVYRKLSREVAVFLHSLHQQWNRILIPSMKPRDGRGYPILADELRYQLGIRSVTLEPIFFTVTRRHMGIMDGPIADQMGQLFQQDAQNDYSKMSEQDQKILKHALISRYKHLTSEYQQSRPPAASGLQHPMQQNMAMPPAVPRQHTIDHGRRQSAGYSGPQTTVPNPNALAQAFDMYPSPEAQHSSNFPNNMAPIPAHFTLRSNTQVGPNAGIQIPVQNMACPPHMAGHLGQPLTPAGSPLHANMQLPNMARVPQAPGQTSPVLQAPPGGLSVSMPMVTSPTRVTAPPGVPGRVPTSQQGFPPQSRGFHEPQSHPSPQMTFPQTFNVDQIHQAFHNAYRQSQASVPANLPNMMSPRVQQMPQMPSPRVNSHQPQPSPINRGHANLPGTLVSTVRPRSTRDISGKLKGPLFRPSFQPVPLDHMPHSSYEPKALAMALHQVDVRSPRRVPRELPMADDATPPERYYQSIRNLAKGPVAVPPRNELHRLVFTVPQEDFDKLCPNVTPIGEQIPVSQYFNGSLRYRLRLCERPAGQKTVSESSWAVAPTHWPDQINIFLNNSKVLKIRRKQHNGQHQPVELTPHVYAGTNELSVAISPQARGQQKPEPDYFIAVEVIETLSHQTVVDMVVRQGTLAAESTKKAIQNRLEPAQEDGDDDIAVVDKDLSIDLADPFSATIFEIPVRGATCTHMECFDLGTWLQTRPAKPKCTYHGAGDDCRICRGPDLGPEPSLVDKWKCPLCDGDARPHSLGVDSFMSEVRMKLEAEGKLHTKTIHVAADGTWRAKVEDVGDDDEDAEADGQPPAKRTKTGSAPSEAVNAIEIIELD